MPIKLRSICREKVKTFSFHKHKSGIVFLLQPSSSLWSPQSLSPSHCHWAGMHVHSPKALTAHVKWLRPQEHSVLLVTPVKEQRKKDILKTSIYFRVNALNTKWHQNFSPCTHYMYEHILYCKEKHPPPPCTVEIGDQVLCTVSWNVAIWTQQQIATYQKEIRESAEK